MAPPRIGVPLPVIYGFGAAATLIGRLRRRDYHLNLNSVRMLHHTSPVDHHKATAELGWQPTPATDAIAAAARFYVDRRERQPKREVRA